MAALAAPQQEAASVAQGSADRAKARAVLVDRRERQRAFGKAHFARGTVANDVDGVEAAKPIEGAGDLRHRGRRCVEPDCGQFGPQSPRQSLDVADRGIYEGDFSVRDFPIGHGVTWQCGWRAKRAGPGADTFVASAPNTDG